MIVQLGSLDDPRLDDYRDVREADRVGRRGIVIAEGDVVLRVLVRRGRLPLRSLLLSESRMAALRDVVERVPPEVPIYVVPQNVMDGVVGFPIHRGALAACSRKADDAAHHVLTSLGEGESRVVALEGLANHDNVGGIFRNAAAFGAGAVLLDATSCDPFYRKAIRVSVGAALFVPFGRAATSRDLIDALHAAAYTVIALTPGEDAVELRDLEVPARAALLLGAEGPGLSREALEAADLRVRIAMAPGFDSLNVATTSGIALHSLATARSPHTRR